jgi:hypothetical protein
MLLPLGKTLLTKFFFGNFLLTKMMARTKLFWPQRPQVLARLCLFNLSQRSPKVLAGLAIILFSTAMKTMLKALTLGQRSRWSA